MHFYDVMQGNPIQEVRKENLSEMYHVIVKNLYINVQTSMDKNVCKKYLYILNNYCISIYVFFFAN